MISPSQDHFEGWNSTFRASIFLRDEMKRLNHIHNAVQELSNKEDNFIAMVDRMIHELDDADSEEKMLID